MVAVSACSMCTDNTYENISNNRIYIYEYCFTSLSRYRYEGAIRAGQPYIQRLNLYAPGPLPLSGVSFLLLYIISKSYIVAIFISGFGTRNKMIDLYVILAMSFDFSHLYYRNTQFLFWQCHLT